jgi:hypothetical protein
MCAIAPIFRMRAASSGRSLPNISRYLSYQSVDLPDRALSGDTPGAAALYERSLAIFQALGDRRGQAEAMLGLARWAEQVTEYERVHALSGEALALFHLLGDTGKIAETLFTLATVQLSLLGHVELASGNTRPAAVLFAGSIELHHTLGAMMFAPWCLEGAAGVGAAQGQWHRVACACGARAALLERLNSHQPPIQPAAYDNTVGTARSILGEASFTGEFAAGRRFGPNEAVELALAAG